MIIFFFFVGLLTGTIDAIAGGGGLISLPFLLSWGLPPHVALATNRFQSTVGTSFAVFHYRRAGLVRLREIWIGILMAGFGAAIGTLTVRTVDTTVLSQIVPWLLLIVFLYTLVSPRLGEVETRPRIPAVTFYLLFGFGLGFYDGFFGPGTGMFWTIAFVTVKGFNLKQATAHTKVVNLASNVVSTAVFLQSGYLVVLPIAVAMSAGQIVGATLGAKIVILKGTRLVRVVYMCVVCVMLLKMFWNLYWSP